MAILPTKQVKIFTVINYKMSISFNDMLNSIINVHIKGSCGVLWYLAVSCGNQTDPQIIFPSITLSKTDQSLLVEHKAMYILI